MQRNARSSPPLSLPRVHRLRNVHQFKLWENLVHFPHFQFGGLWIRLVAPPFCVRGAHGGWIIHKAYLLALWGTIRRIGIKNRFVCRGKRRTAFPVDLGEANVDSETLSKWSPQTPFLPCLLSVFLPFLLRTFFLSLYFVSICFHIWLFSIIFPSSLPPSHFFWNIFLSVVSFDALFLWLKLLLSEAKLS